MRQTGLRWWVQDLGWRFWSFGFEVYRHPTMFSSGRGPEYGASLHLGPWRLHANYSKPYSAADLARIRAAAPVIRRER